MLLVKINKPVRELQFQNRSNLPPVQMFALSRQLCRQSAV